ncbi:MAG: hypothetical protein IJ091_09830 [Oscillospiraceae bacterium]|nr:hypothetical protein [Oscillospiraceae bacterium]
MNEIIARLLQGESGDHIFPFFWQHGEDEATLRKMMRVIRDSGCKSVCIESRPHPDFCGDKWWTDMDIILEEARGLGMKVWILDDSHFPTGFCNGKVLEAEDTLRRQSLVAGKKVFKGKEKEVTIDLTKIFPPKLKAPTFISGAANKFVSGKNAPFHDDEILSVVAVGEDGTEIALPIGNTGKIGWKKPAGTWTVWVSGLSRNYGIHRSYMNMMDRESCRILIDEVYEKHYAHYAEDFGKTIEGFFSDEPELGNGFYATNLDMIGKEIDLPFSREMPAELEASMGPDWKNKLYLFWSDSEDKEKTAAARLAFMDAVTRLVRKDFSEQVGNWCREHGVKYIGHVIEDNNSHSRTGTSLGHYFRGLNGQDYSGIDDIGGQVYPQKEDAKMKTFAGPRDGEFFHFMLGTLGASAAAIEPRKKGNAMCEIFGNYGWSEGVRLEKYLADHFMVRGINNFVPHAFTGKEFPDPDCPPHFYAQGHNPQYRHFGAIVEYMNRVCTITSGGHRMSSVAVLYNAESEWMGDCMLTQKPLRVLAENQILADVVPIDAFLEKERYGTSYEDGLKIGNQNYSVLLLPYAQFITSEFAEELSRIPVPVYFIDGRPEKTVSGDNEVLEKYPVVALADVAKTVRPLLKDSLEISPKSRDMRLLIYKNPDTVYYLFNEAAEPYTGTLDLDPNKEYYEYDAWENRIYPITSNTFTIEPSKSLILVEGEPDASLLAEKPVLTGTRKALTTWRRSICASLEYPSFGEEKEGSLPDNLEKEMPKFSGIVRYTADVPTFKEGKAVLEITDAYEGVQLFVNGKALAIQVVPPFRYDLTGLLSEENNQLAIEVATTLEREMAARQRFDIRSLAQGQGGKPTSPSGINGQVFLWTSVKE